LWHRKELPGLAVDESAVMNFGCEFFRTRRVSRGAFQSVLEQFGLIMGNSCLLALLIKSFDSHLPPERTEPS